MQTMNRLAGIATLLLAAVSVPAWSQQTASERADLARYQQYAGTPVDNVRYYQINGFEYLAPDTVAIWFGVNKLYLLTVQTPCTGLAFANAIGLSAKTNTLYANLDFVTFAGQRCQITRIVPVDELKMKQDKTRADAPPAASD